MIKKININFINQFKNNYVVNNLIINRLNNIKNNVVKSTHVLLNKKIDKKELSENIQTTIIFLNKLSSDNFNKIINDINIIINNEKDINLIVNNLINNAINYYKINNIFTQNNKSLSIYDDLFVYSKLIKYIILNKYKWYYKNDKNIILFRHSLLLKCYDEHNKYFLIIKNENNNLKNNIIQNKKNAIGFYIFLTTLFINGILSKKSFDELYLNLIDIIYNNDIIEILIYINKILIDFNKNDYYNIFIKNINKNTLQNRLRILIELIFTINIKNIEQKNIDNTIDDNKNKLFKILEDSLYNDKYDIFEKKIEEHNIDNKEIIIEFIKIISDKEKEIIVDIPKLNINKLKINLSI